MDLARLFEAGRGKLNPKLVPYPDEDVMLDAVRARRKGMLTGGTGQPHRCNTAGRKAQVAADLAQYRHAALDRNLAFAMSPEDASGIKISILHLDQIWRIAAERVHWASALDMYGVESWSFTTDAISSIIYGYSDEESVAWQRRMRHATLPNGRVAYALLTRRQRARVVESGHRVLGTATDLEGLTLFKHGRHAAIRRTAASQIPRGRTLARFALEIHFSNALFDPDWVRRVFTCKLDRTAARALNTQLESKIEFLGPDGWHS